MLNNIRHNYASDAKDEEKLGNSLSDFPSYCKMEKVFTFSPFCFIIFVLVVLKLALR